jgi:hypothetical protein
MFVQISGRTVTDWLPKAASQVFSFGALAYWNGSGGLIPADSTSGDHAGVVLRAVAATDTDYASATSIPVVVPHDDAIFLADVTGNFTTACVGNAYDLSDSLIVNVGATSKKVVTCVGYVSSTQGLFKINAVAHNVDVATS